MKWGKLPSEKESNEENNSLEKEEEENGQERNKVWGGVVRFLLIN